MAAWLSERIITSRAFVGVDLTLLSRDGPVQCHFDAAELGSVHRGLALRAEMSAVGDDGIIRHGC